MTTLNDLTIEHLGDDATAQDLAQFKGWVRELMARDEMTDEDAIDALFGDGDYLANAQRLGLN